MARHDPIDPSVLWGPDEALPSFDELIRPGLRRAFPLPAAGHGDDEPFRRVLAALARHRQGDTGPGDRPKRGPG
jgi:hypothetical protein